MKINSDLLVDVKIPGSLYAQEFSSVNLIKHFSIKNNWHVSTVRTDWVRLQRPTDVTSFITANAIANGGNIYKNVNWNNLTQGFYVVNTWTGTGGSNYPAENLSGICIAFAAYQICYAQNKIYTRHKRKQWLDYMKFSYTYLVKNFVKISKILGQSL